MSASRGGPATEGAGTQPEDFGIGRLFWVMRDAVVVADARSGRIALWNPAAEALFGYPAAEAVGMPLDALVPDRLRAAHRAGLKRYAATGHGRLVDSGAVVALPGRRRDGTEVPIELALAPLEVAAKSLVGGRYVLATIRDASARVAADAEHLERVRADASRVQAEALAAEREAVLAQLAEGVVITDPQGQIVFVNEAARRLHGVAELGVPVHGYSQAYGLFTLEGAPYPPEDLPLARAVLRGETVTDARWRIRRPDGTEVVAEGGAAPVRAADGTRLGNVLTVRDVTAQVALEREKELFLAAAAHDLKTPITAVYGSAQVLARRLREGRADPDRMASGLANIQTAARQMEALVDELLDLARLRMDQPLDLDRRPTDLVALARQAVDRHRHDAGRERVRLETEQPELVGEWDPTRLARVLDNLLGNAVKYSPEGGEVLVRVARAPGSGPGDEQAVLSVADQGVGIPAADLSRIFERFRRGGNVAGRIGGTGIGLAAAKQVVEQHGGVIEVASTEGQGSTFSVRLPLVPGA